MVRTLHIDADSYQQADLAKLAAIGVMRTALVRTTEQLLLELERDPVDALFVGLGVRVDARALKASPTLRWVVSPTTGLDHIDRTTLEGAGVRVVSLLNARERISTVHATAELTWGLLLAVMRHIPAAHAAAGAGTWDRVPYLGSELHGRAIGLVGHGRLGAMVAEYARSFGMQVLAHDIEPAAVAALPTSERVDTADDLLPQCDVLSLHMKLNDTSRGWLSEERIARLPRGSVVVNTARGDLVDEAALLSALRSGHLAGVGADVLAHEMDPDRLRESPLIRAVAEGFNVVLTPHIGGWAQDAVALTRSLIVQLFLEQLHSVGCEDVPS